MEPEAIWNACKDIHSHVGTEEEKKEYAHTEYAELCERYPKLVEVCCSPTTPSLETLRFMVDRLKDMTHRGLTEFNASAQVGQRLFAKYLPQNNKDKSKLE